MTTEEIAQALRLVAGISKDRTADGAFFGFANEQAGQQQTESFKDLSPKQRTKLLDEVGDF